MEHNFFKKTPLAKIFGSVEFCFWDIGARGDFDTIFGDFAWAVDAVGFESDPAAFEKLSPTGKWRSENFIKTAIGNSSGEASLNITTDPIGSSFLEHNKAVGERYHLKDFFSVKETVTVPTLTLPDVLQQRASPPPDLLKLDVEGFELAILKAGADVLKSVVAIKVEGAFLEQRLRQPLAPELIAWLEGQGFCLMEMIEPAKWRVRSWASDPYSVKSSPSYSRGRLAQADFVFLREPESLDGGIAAKAALAAIGLGYFDHGLEIFEAHQQVISDRLKVEPDTFRSAVNAASKLYGKARASQEISAGLAHLWRLLRSYFGGLNTPG